VKNNMKINPENLTNWDKRKSYSSEELGLDKGMWDYVSKDGTLGIIEEFEDICADAFDKANGRIMIFGRAYKASEVAREVSWEDWNDFVQDAFTRVVSHGAIRRIN
jgi:hypothetical protein